MTFADKDELCRILEKTFDEDHPEDVIRVIATFAHMARCEGLLSLESYASDPKSPELQVLLRLLVNGTEPAVIQEVSRNLIKGGLARREAFLEILSQGTNALNQGYSPRVIFELLYSILGKPAPDGLTMNPGDAHEVLSSEERDALCDG